MSCLIARIAPQSHYDWLQRPFTDAAITTTTTVTVIDAHRNGLLGLSGAGLPGRLVSQLLTMNSRCRYPPASHEGKSVVSASWPPCCRASIHEKPGRSRHYVSIPRHRPLSRPRSSELSVLGLQIELGSFGVQLTPKGVRVQSAKEPSKLLGEALTLLSRYERSSGRMLEALADLQDLPEIARFQTRASELAAALAAASDGEGEPLEFLRLLGDPADLMLHEARSDLNAAVEQLRPLEPTVADVDGGVTSAGDLDSLVGDLVRLSRNSLLSRDVTQRDRDLWRLTGPAVRDYRDYSGRVRLISAKPSTSAALAATTTGQLAIGLASAFAFETEPRADPIRDLTLRLMVIASVLGSEIEHRDLTSQSEQQLVATIYWLLSAATVVLTVLDGLFGDVLEAAGVSPAQASGATARAAVAARRRILDGPAPNSETSTPQRD